MLKIKLNKSKQFNVIYKKSALLYLWYFVLFCLLEKQNGYPTVKKAPLSPIFHASIYYSKRDSIDENYSS